MQISASYPGQEGFSRSIHRVSGNSGPPARPTAPPGVRQIGVAASLLMAAMGISVYALSGSEALLLDGLLSGVMAASSFIAARFGSNVVRPADRAYPYGYDGQEALYVLFRSLVLIGILSFAVITAGTTIVNHLGGQAVAAVQLRSVATYAGLMVVLCLALRQSAGAACAPGLIARTRDAGEWPLDRSAAGADRRALRRTPGPRAHRSDPHGAGPVRRMIPMAGS